MDWYYARNGQQYGPLSEEQLKQMIAAGQVLSTDLVWKAGMPGWVPAPQVFPPAVPAGGPPPPPPPPGFAPQPQLQPIAPGAPQPRQRIAYILLGVFLGGLGIHNFYAGYTGRAVAQLLISILSCGILSLVSWIWAIVEICTVTTDAEGRLLTQ